jgi:hypothetical protein
MNASTSLSNFTPADLRTIFSMPSFYHEGDPACHITLWITWNVRLRSAEVFFRTRAPAWPVAETGQVLVGRWGGTGPESGIGDAAKGGLGNGWSAIRTTQEPMPDGPLEVGEATCAWVNAARVAWKAEPAEGWQRSLMHHETRWRELDRRLSEPRLV